MRPIISRYRAGFDLDHQRLELVTQVAHGADARHPRAALQGVQLALQVGHALLVVTVKIPGSQRVFGGLQQLGGFLAVDIGDLQVKLVVRRRHRQCRHHAGHRIRVGGVRQRGIEFGLQRLQPGQQRRLLREEGRVLVDVGHHVFDGADRLRERRQPVIGQALAAVEHFAHVAVQRLRDAHALARFGHLRAAAQGVNGAVHALRQGMRCGLSGTLAQVIAYFGQVTRSLLAVDVVQHRIHGGWCRQAQIRWRLDLSYRRRLHLGYGRRLHLGYGRRLHLGYGRRLHLGHGCRRDRRGLRRRRCRERGRPDRCSRRRRGDRRQGGGVPGTILRRHVPQRGLFRIETLRIGIGARHERIHAHRQRPPGLELFDQRRQCGDRRTQQRHHPRRAGQRFVEQPVEQILHGPGEFADQVRADHAAAALQGVKAAPQCGERLQVHGILVPQRKAHADRGDLFLRFFDEQFQELRIGRSGERPGDRLGGAVRAPGPLQGRGPLGHRRHVPLEHLGDARLGGGRQRGHAQRLFHLERVDADLGVVEHVPRIVAAALQSLHVVFDADDGIGHALQTQRIRRRRAGFHQRADVRADGIHQLHGPALAEHQQSRGDPAQQLRHVVESLRRIVPGLVHGGRYGILDARQIDDAFAQHRFAHQAELGVLVGGRIGLFVAALCGQDQAHQLIVEAVLDRQQHAGHLDERLLGRGFAHREHFRQIGDLLLHPLAQCAQAEHPQGVADLLQQIELRRELIDATAAAAHENVEHVLHLGQILLDGACDRVHQFDAGRGQAFALVLDGIVDGQQLRQPERGAHRADAAALGGGARHVIQQIVEQIDGRVLAIAGLADLVQGLDLPVGLPEQALEGGAARQSVRAQRLDHRARDPPELKYRLGGRDLLELFGHLSHDVEILIDALAADVAQEADLKPGPQAPRPLRDGDGCFARLQRPRLRRLVGLQIEQQQRAFGEQRAAAHRAQVVEQRQQHQGQIPAAREHPLEIGRQLHHGAHQRVQAVELALLIAAGVDQITRDVLHLLGEQRGTVHLDQAQHPVRDMQVVSALFEQIPLFGTFRIGLERFACVGERDRQFLGDQMQCLGADVGHAWQWAGMPSSRA